MSNLAGGSKVNSRLDRNIEQIQVLVRLMATTEQIVGHSVNRCKQTCDYQGEQSSIYQTTTRS